MSVLNVRVSPTRRNGVERWQGTVSVPGCRPTKLVRQADDTTDFPTRGAVLSSASNLARKLKYTLKVFGTTPNTKTKTKQATRSR